MIHRTKAVITGLAAGMILGGSVWAGPAVSLHPIERPAQSAAPTEVRVENAGFSRWIQGFRGRARAQGISDRTLDRAFRNVQYDQDVIERDRNQSEFTKTIWDYLDSAVSSSRVTNGKK
ncbi:MAG: lytic murein transglycosylase, partial [Pseudomonadota bacterium]